MSSFGRMIKFAVRYIVSLACCVYLFTVGVFFARNRWLLDRIRRHFGFGPASRDGSREPELHIPTVSIEEAAPGDPEIRILEPLSEGGNVSLLELTLICKMVRQCNPRMCFEIGTFDGRTTLNLAANTSESCRIVTLDLPVRELGSAKLKLEYGDIPFVDKQTSGTRYHDTPYKDRISQYYGDSASFDFSAFINKMDFVFVDGSHSYEYVLNDTEIALKLLRDGKGTIMWHDYGSECWPGLTRALDQMFDQRSELRGMRHIAHTSLVYLRLE